MKHIFSLGTEIQLISAMKSLDKYEGYSNISDALKITEDGKQLQVFF